MNSTLPIPSINERRNCPTLNLRQNALTSLKCFLFSKCSAKFLNFFLRRASARRSSTRLRPESSPNPRTSRSKANQVPGCLQSPANSRVSEQCILLLLGRFRLTSLCSFSYSLSRSPARAISSTLPVLMSPNRRRKPSLSRWVPESNSKCT